MRRNTDVYALVSLPLSHLYACPSDSAGAQELFAVANARAREREERVEAAGAFLRDGGVPSAAAQRVREWVRYQYVCARADRQSRDALAALPAELREEVAGAVCSGLLGKVPLLSRIPDGEDRLRARFVAALLPALSTAFFLRGTVVARHDEPADRVFILCSGTVAARLPPAAGPPAPVLVLRARDSFGDNALLGDARWGGVYGLDVDFVACEDCRAVWLDAAAARAVAEDPEFPRIRRLLERFAYRAPAARPDLEFEQYESGGGGGGGGDRPGAVAAGLGVWDGRAWGERCQAAPVRRARAVCRWIRASRALLRGAPPSADLWAFSAARMWARARPERASFLHDAAACGSGGGKDSNPAAAAVAVAPGLLTAV